MKNVIIVAGGKGLRTGRNLPKQFIPVGGKPVLMRTVEAFYNYDPDIRIIVVLEASYPAYWKEICTAEHFTVPHLTAIGGETRFHSVKNGLALVNDGLVAVHDAARPFVSGKLIRQAFEEAALHNAVVPAINATDSLRLVEDGNNSRIIDRTKIKLVQTPQVFDSDLLKAAYQTEYRPDFTDDASVVEAHGGRISLFDGEATNIKITTPFDLEMAEVILKLSSQP
ncbi:MAG: 2-C-methyl-D-erythritol 4-phosphate cytidylyltransferase [Prevotella sp.]|nr:2-C-methyl-D-erythritol 4-phosphate cytidylyltransferase [Prevotella sp.]